MGCHKLYCAPLYNPSFLGTPKIGTKTIAAMDQISNITPYAFNSGVIQTLHSYATLNSPALTGQPTITGYPVLFQSDHCIPAFIV